ncbi:unnamed protein product [Callosobruchus maculatus]|uniref:RRM domain-containing protein n=1 Tax=Callosobruchus maculatus TaxID=64391 RepID=A0A653BXZ1_CALMS|nr:unnamed protein product [Callosobruchus maculatus]
MIVRPNEAVKGIKKIKEMARRDSSKDFPPHSRLLIVHSKILNAGDFHRYFHQFGNIEDLHQRQLLH